MNETTGTPQEILEELNEISPTETTDLAAQDPISTFEEKEDQVIINQMQSASVEEYIYQFKQAGRMVTGLTLAGVNEAANRRGNIEVEDITVEEKDESWLVTVKARDKTTNTSRYGAYEQPKIFYNKPDPFAYTKAVHKAQRNAIKQLLPVPVIKKVLDYYLQPQSERKKTDLVLEAPVDSKKNAVKLAKDLRPKLRRKGLELEDLWNFVKIDYNIESSESMDDSQWAQLEAELIAAKVSTRCFRELVHEIQQTLVTPSESEDPQVEEEVEEKEDA